MDEITINDTLEYFKFQISEISKMYSRNTMPRQTLTLTFLIGCVLAILTSENENLVFWAGVGLIISLVFLASSFLIFLYIKKRLKNLRIICKLIINGDIKTPSDALSEYQKRCPKTPMDMDWDDVKKEMEKQRQLRKEKQK